METNISHMGPACQQYEELLEDYLGGSLDASSGQAVARHLADCSNCRSAFEAAQDGVRLFQAAGLALEPSHPGPAFARVVMARVGQEKERRAAERLSYWQPVVAFAWRFAATAMLALMILLSYAVRGRGRTRQVVGPIGQQSALVDVFSPDPTRTPANQDEVLIMVAEPAHGSR